MKKVILWIVFLVLCFLGMAAYVGYRSFNTEKFKEQIIQSVQKATGRTFSVKGDSQLTWRPLPTITLDQVTLSNMTSSLHPEMMTAEKIQVQIEWTSLFKSPIRIKSLTIIKPVISVEILSRSENNIQFPILFAPKNVLMAEATFTENKVQAQIDNIHVEEGQLEYLNNITKHQYTFSNINGDLAMGTLSGPFKFNGTLTLGDIAFDTSFSLGTREVSQPMDLIADLQTSSLNTHLKIDAKFLPENPESFLTGSVSLDMAQPNSLLEHLKLPVFPPKYNVATVATFTTELGFARTAISDFMLKIDSGDTELTANANYKKEGSTQPGQLDLTVSSLNLDEWMDTLAKLLQQKTILNHSLTFNTTISQLIWHNQTATTLHLEGEIAQNQMHIHTGSILLPGSTTTQFSGTLTQADNNFSLKTDIDLQSQNVASFLSFLNPPQNKLTELLQKAQQAELKSVLNWTPDVFDLKFSALSLDDATGTAHFLKKTNEPTTFVLQLDHIDLNTYFPEANKAQTLTQVWHAAQNFVQNTKLPDYPTNWNLQFNQAKWQKTDFDNMTLISKTENNSAMLDLSATTQNEDLLTLTTTIRNIGSANWFVAQGKFKIRSMAFPEFLQDLHIKNDVDLLQNAQQLDMTGNMDGNPQSWHIDTTVQTQAIALTLKGTLSNNQPDLLNIHFQHHDVAHFLFELWGKNPLKNLTGNIVINTNMTQKNQTLLLSDLEITADTEQLSGTAQYDLSTQEWTCSLSGDKINLQKVVPEMTSFYSKDTGFDGNPFDFSLFQRLKGTFNFSANDLFYHTTHLQNASLQAHINDEALYIDNFMTTGNSTTPSTIQAKGTLSWTQSPSFNFQIATQALPLTTPFMMFNGVGLREGILTSEWDLTSSGETPLQMAQNLTGQGQIYLEKPVWIGADLTSLIKILDKAQDLNDSEDDLSSQIKYALTHGTTAVDLVRGQFAINNGLWESAALTVGAKQALSAKATVNWNIATTDLQAKIPLRLKEYVSFPPLILELIKNQKGTTYTSDTSAFLSAFLAEIDRRRKQQKEAELKAEQAALAKELSEAKKLATRTLQELADVLNFWTQQLATTPDATIQKEVLKAQELLAVLTPQMKGSDLTTQNYQEMTQKAKQALAEINKAQKGFVNQQKELMDKNGQQLLQQAKSLVLQINELHQKRPNLDVLGELLQQAEEEEKIIVRALEQYQKPISFHQIKQIGQIIQESREKIGEIYENAADIYSGRQSMSTISSIQRLSP